MPRKCAWTSDDDGTICSIVSIDDVVCANLFENKITITYKGNQVQTVFNFSSVKVAKDFMKIITDGMLN